MKKIVEISVEREDKKNTHTMIPITATCTVWDKSGNGWVKMRMDGESYWIHSRELKKLLRIAKKMK